MLPLHYRGYGRLWVKKLIITILFFRQKGNQKKANKRPAGQGTTIMIEFTCPHGIGTAVYSSEYVAMCCLLCENAIA